MLDVKQLAAVKKVLATVTPGLYVLKTLFGDAWAGITHRPRAYGRWFRRSVLRGDLPGIRWVKKRSDKRHEYAVVAREERDD